MPDRIDIDALLIGALYGELTPADEALLAAHLESHPADRTALADLTRTRAAIRNSRLLAVQLEPPQAISALLLQEASRRAPRSDARGARDRETASWFQRFVRPFVAHPAMAAAAMLVLVVGVAGTFYLRGTDQFAESPPPDLPSQLPSQASLARNAVPPMLEAPATATPPTGGAAAAAPEPEAQAGDRVAAGSAAGIGAVAGSDGYRVDLDDGARAQPALTKQGDLPARAGREKSKAGLINPIAEAEAPKRAARPPAEPADTRDDKPAKPTRSGEKLAGIVVRTPELSPRELKESDDEAPDRARRPISGDRDVATAAERVTRGAEPGAPGGAPPAPAAGMPAPVPSAPAQVGSEPAPAFEPGAVAKTAPSDAKKLDAKKFEAKNEATNEATNAATKPLAKPAPAKLRQSAPAAAPPPPPANDSARFAGKVAGPATKDTAATDKPSTDKPLIDWARKRHEQVKTLVSANNCRAAASAATEIYSRAPDYYAANVVTDRTIKPCLAYLNTDREREDRSRAAAKAVMPADAPVQAAPPTRK